MEPKVALSFLCSPTMPTNNPIGGTSGKLRLMARQWEVGSPDPVLRHNPAAKQIISTFNSPDIKSNYEILKEIKQQI